MKLSYEELSAEGGSFEGDYRFSEGDFKVNVKSYRADFLPTDAGLYLDLGFEYEFAAPCDRCLEETTGFGSERSGIQLSKAEKEAKEEKELSDDDMGIIYVDEDEIDLDEIIRQEVIFYLPVRMVCGEDCKGLCPECGENLNTGSCKCEKAVDPRWSALKNIKKS